MPTDNSNILHIVVLSLFFSFIFFSVEIFPLEDEVEMKEKYKER